MDRDNRQSKVKRYSAVKSRLAFAGMAVPALSALVFHFVFSTRLMQALETGIALKWVVYVVYTLIFLLFVYAWILPLKFTGSFLVERAYGLSRRSVGSWISDEIKSGLLNLMISTLAIMFFYWTIISFPVSWWLICSLAWIFFSVVFSFAVPVLIIPLFFRYIPLKEGEIKSNIEKLALRTGVVIKDICGIDLSSKTLKANAAVVGVGSTRKVILADTLTDNFTPDEITMVAAHEFGHHKLLHIPKLLAFSSFWVFVGLYGLYLLSVPVSMAAGVEGIGVISTLPVIFILGQIFEFILLPVKNVYSRILEKEADKFALDSVKLPEVFISTMKKLAKMNFADTIPPFMRKIFLYTHPPIGERIAMAGAYSPDQEKR